MTATKFLGLWILLAALVALVALAGPLTADDGPSEPPAAKERGQAAHAKAVAALMRSTKVTLAGAISLAEKRTGGQAFGAKVEREDGRIVFDIQTIVQGERVKIMEVEIDAVTGAVLEIEDETDGEDDADDDDYDDDDDDNDNDDNDNDDNDNDDNDDDDDDEDEEEDDE